jgi:hypothetical protein
MNIYPVRLAAGLVLIALCARAEEAPAQLPTQVVYELRYHMDEVNRDLDQAFQREEMTALHAFYQKALTKNTEVDLLGLLLVAQKTMDSRVDVIPGTRDQAVLPPDEASKRVVAVPILRSSW